MSSEKYIGLDVHQATISVAVMFPKAESSSSPFWKRKRRQARAAVLALEHDHLLTQCEVFH